MHLPPFLRDQYTPNTLWLCKLSKGILQPSCPCNYKRAGLHGLTLVSLLLDQGGISIMTLKYLGVGGVNPLPALPLPFSLNKTPRLAVRSTGSPPGSVPLMHQFTGLGEKVPFLFPIHLFTVFVLSLICCSLVDIKSLFTLSPGHSQAL